MSDSPLDARSALRVLREADRRWAAAVHAGAGPVSRLRELGDAAEEEANALRLVYAVHIPWEPREGAVNLRLTYEFSPEAPRPGPAQLWQQFDAAVQRLGSALEGTSMIAVARAFEALSDGAREIAQAISDSIAAQPASTG